MSRRLDNYRTQLQRDLEHIARTLNLPAGDVQLAMPRAVYLTYAAPRGHALIDRALYLPRSWAEDPHRCDGAGIPQTNGVSRPNPGGLLLLESPCRRQRRGSRRRGHGATGAAVAIRSHGLGYVLGVSANRRVPTPAGPIRVDQLPAYCQMGLAETLRRAGSHGHRVYSWAWIALLPKRTPTR